MYESFAFYLFSALILVSFSFSVFCKNALNAVSALAAGMVFISAIFFLLGAEFLGVVQIIVYTGAVVVLYAFAMMFFDSSKECEPKSSKRAKIIVYLLSSFVALLLIFIFLAPIYSVKLESLNPVVGELGNIEAIGILLFSRYLIAFEMCAVMLLVAMVAGIILIHKDMNSQSSLEEIL
ncbi:NADH:ubiquinone oxidoreductase subunit J [Campylobacter concisus]|uniref:NADH-quinone oxidoreductase subunit J n=1 Tax=Campylobacter concisus TaxID=199 RepID=UPI000B3D683D|nr:NADH-quinone oxidoreductase subunit J [Campylobacter concisus]OUT10537.1 NADH:ubiquinone oxidoreductase subunit J [Campylobacter concisus]